jgi:sortase A
MIRHWIYVLLLLGGFSQLAGGVWILVKAEVAQYLIRDAWAKQLAGGQTVKPWPWADTWPVAQLQLQDQAPLTVLGGGSGQALAFAPALLSGSGDPGEFSQARTTVIAAHRDTHFRNIGQLRSGAAIQLQDSRGRWHSYRVSETRVVDSEREQLPIFAEPGLLLVTCYPFNAIDPGGPLRYLVYAEYQGGAAPVQL